MLKLLILWIKRKNTEKLTKKLDQILVLNILEESLIFKLFFNSVFTSNRQQT